MKNGIFTISLDFELYWGMLDVCPPDEIKESLLGTKHAIQEMLRVFTQFDVHVTWAVVGLMFAKNQQEALHYHPAKRPLYTNKKLNPYSYIEKSVELEEPYHFASGLIEKIQNTANQEVASHTYSHFYCLEEEQSIDAFREDIRSAIEIAKLRNINLKSLVFPRNQWSPECLDVLKEFGISSYRGNETSWMYQTLNEGNIGVARRVVKQLDALINISGFNTYSVNSNSKYPLNIAASRQLRSHGKLLSIFDKAKKKRICNAMKHAAQKGEVFHLWWHPEDFGENTKFRIEFLTEILKYYKYLNSEYGMQSLNMAEISAVKIN